MVAPEYLAGNETVRATNVTAVGDLAFSLPGARAPRVRVQLRGGPDASRDTHLDTVIINTDDKLLLLLWRTSFRLRSGPLDVVSIEISQ